MKNIRIIDETTLIRDETHYGIISTDSTGKTRASWIPAWLFNELAQLSDPEDHFELIEEFSSAIKAWTEVKSFRDSARQAQSINEGLKEQYSHEE